MQQLTTATIVLGNFAKSCCIQQRHSNKLLRSRPNNAKTPKVARRRRRARRARAALGPNSASAHAVALASTLHAATKYTHPQEHCTRFIFKAFHIRMQQLTTVTVLLGISPQRVVASHHETAIRCMTIDPKCPKTQTNHPTLAKCHIPAVKKNRRSQAPTSNATNADYAPLPHLRDQLPE